MAEATCKEQCKKESEGDTKDKCDIECAVCLQKCVHPAQLPCGHIFCFLCVKGIANQSKRCAMCRQEIPRDFIEHPKLLERLNVTEAAEGFDGGYLWFYEGRNGWWQYDLRANEEIETMYNLKVPSYEMLICGELYIIDFENNVQYPKRNSSKKRSIRRQANVDVEVKVKGVAGLMA